jgi:hypothetical protein
VRARVRARVRVRVRVRPRPTRVSRGTKPCLGSSGWLGFGGQPLPLPLPPPLSLPLPLTRPCGLLCGLARATMCAASSGVRKFSTSTTVRVRVRVRVWGEEVRDLDDC